MRTSVFFTPEDAGSFRTAVCASERSHAIVDFVKQNGFVDKKNTNPPSHFMYGGLYGLGKLHVPQCSTAGLADAVVKDFMVGVYSGLTENKPHGKPVRFYIDFDFSFTTLDGAEAMWDLVQRIMQEEVCKFFPTIAETDSLFDVMILSAGAKRVADKFKAGIHAIWQNLFVDVDTALYITSALIHRLEIEARAMTDEPGIWAKRIDQCVYADGRGLRWAWQLKTKKCSVCGAGDTKRFCTSCSFGVAIDKQASMYAPVYLLRAGGEKRAIDCDRSMPTVELLLASSIRAIDKDAPTAGFTLYPGHPPLPRLLTKRGGQNVSLTLAGKTSSSREDLIVSYDPKFDVVTKGIRRVHKMYENISVEKIATKAKGYAVSVQGLGSCYCMNYGKDHNKQRVKFFVTVNGITQSCYCKCEVVRPSGKMCKDYMSDRVPLTNAEKDVLFPQQKRRIVTDDEYVDSSKFESDIVAACSWSSNTEALKTPFALGMAPLQRLTMVSNCLVRKRKK